MPRGTGVAPTSGTHSDYQNRLAPELRTPNGSSPATISPIMSAVLFLTGRVLVLNGSSSGGQTIAGGRQLRVANLQLSAVSTSAATSSCQMTETHASDPYHDFDIKSRYRSSFGRASVQSLKSSLSEHHGENSFANGHVKHITI